MTIDRPAATPQAERADNTMAAPVDRRADSGTRRSSSRAGARAARRPRPRRPGRRVLAGLALIGLAALHSSVAFAAGSTTAARAAEEAKECPVKTNTAKFGRPLKQPVELTPTQQSAQKLVNFGTSRQYKVLKHVTVTTSKALPPAVASDQINYDAVLSRTGSTLESAEFPDPTFSPAYISQDRRSISFAVCLNPDAIAAGKYVGSITVSGPPGLGSASIGLTVNAKDTRLFWLSLGAALLSAFVLLVLKDAAAAKTDANSWRQAFITPLSNPLWCAATIITLATAWAALETIYSNDPAWGASGFASFASLVGTATAAVGGHTILTSLGTKRS